MSDSAGGELPIGWVAARLGAVGDLICGQSPPSSTVNKNRDGTVYVSGPEHWDGAVVHADKWTTAPARVVPEGTVFITVKGAGVGTVFPGIPAAIGRDIYAFLPSDGVPTNFVTHALRFTAAEIVRQAKGDIPGLSKDHILNHLVAIPPLDEQKRIADCIDELLSDLDAGVAALERVRTKLKHYRAAVLKAAVEGALTAQWRREHPTTETADALLTRILAERRRRWEEAQLKKFEAAGKAPPKNWRDKYVEPVATDSGSLPATPEGWCWASIDQLSLEVRNGYSAKPDATTGVPILRISAVRPYSIDLHDRRYLSGRELDYASDQIAEGDLLFTRYNGSRNLVGVCAAVPKLDEPIVHPDKLIRARLVESESASAFTGLAANVGASRKYIEQRIRTTAGQAGVSGSDVKALPVPLPPIAEQAAIVEAVEDQLSVIDHLERDLETRLQSAQSLRQSILRHAFTGQLVPQDPNDEPASELLKRIATEREERAQLAAVAKRKAKPAKAGRARNSRRARTDARE